MAFGQDDQVEQDQPDDLRGDLAAAFAADTGATDNAGTENIVQPDAAAEQRARDEQGRFAAKAADAQTDKTNTGQAQNTGTEAQVEPIRPPASWSAEAKAAFTALPPIVQQEVLKREKDVTQGFEQRANDLKRYEPLEQVIAPHREKWAMRGIDEAAAIRALVAAEDALERDPINAIAHLARVYNVDLRRFGQALGQAQQPQQGQQQVQLPPQVLQELQTLRNQVALIQGEGAQARQAEVVGMIEAFSADPKNVYFTNVEKEVAGILRAGLAEGKTAAERLQDAYEKACWARPDIRKLIQTDQGTADQSKQLQDKRARTDAARKASGSITGSPTPGSGGDAPAETLRGEIERQFAAHRA